MEMRTSEAPEAKQQPVTSPECLRETEGVKSAANPRTVMANRLRAEAMDSVKMTQ